MKRFSAYLAMAMLLAACGQNQQEEQSVAPSTASPDVPAGPKAQAIGGARAAEEGEKGVDLLVASGIALDFPHAINYDIIDTDRNKKPRHRVLVEVLGDDLSAVAEQLSATLTRAGYRKTGDRNNAQRVEQVYAKAGQPTLVLLMQPAGTGPELKNPDSTGSIHIMWNKR